jgi:hypothetical protein
MKKKYQALIPLIIALIAMFFGLKAIITQEATGFITGVATPLNATPYYGIDAIIIGITMIAIAVLSFWWAYKELKRS